MKITINCFYGNYNNNSYNNNYKNNNNNNNYNNNNYNNNNYNNKNYNHKNNNINNINSDISENKNILNENNNNIWDSSQNNLLCLFFHFEEYNKDIYIDIKEEETFSKAIEELKYKYSWLKKLKNLSYVFGGKEIDQNKNIKELELKDTDKVIIKLNNN